MKSEQIKKNKDELVHKATNEEDEESNHGIQICIKNIDEIAIALNHPELL